MLNTSDSANLKTQFNTIKVIYRSLLLGLLLFFGITIYIIEYGNIKNLSNIDSIFIILVPVFGLISMFVSRMIYRQRISNTSASDELVQKIEIYRTSKVISWALVEAGCFFALVAAIVTSNYLYTVVFILLFGYFIMMRPSIESFTQDMRLNSKDSDLIRG